MPNTLPKACQRCGRPTENGWYCEKCTPAKQTERREDNTYRQVKDPIFKLYKQQRWLNFVTQLKANGNIFCQRIVDGVRSSCDDYPPLNKPTAKRSAVCGPQEHSQGMSRTPSTRRGRHGRPRVCANPNDTVVRRTCSLRLVPTTRRKGKTRVPALDM